MIQCYLWSKTYNMTHVKMSTFHIECCCFKMDIIYIHGSEKKFSPCCIQNYGKNKRMNPFFHSFIQCVKFVSWLSMHVQFKVKCKLRKIATTCRLKNFNAYVSNSLLRGDIDSCFPTEWIHSPSCCLQEKPGTSNPAAVEIWCKCSLS